MERETDKRRGERRATATRRRRSPERAGGEERGHERGRLPPRPRREGATLTSYIHACRATKDPSLARPTWAKVWARPPTSSPFSRPPLTDRQSNLPRAGHPDVPKPETQKAAWSQREAVNNGRRPPARSKSAVARRASSAERAGTEQGLAQHTPGRKMMPRRRRGRLLPEAPRASPLLGPGARRCWRRIEHEIGLQRRTEPV